MQTVLYLLTITHGHASHFPSLSSLHTSCFFLRAYLDISIGIYIWISSCLWDWEPSCFWYLSFRSNYSSLVSAQPKSELQSIPLGEKSTLRSSAGPASVHVPQEIEKKTWDILTSCKTYFWLDIPSAKLRGSTIQIAAKLWSLNSSSQS